MSSQHLEDAPFVTGDDELEAVGSLIGVVEKLRRLTRSQHIRALRYVKQRYPDLPWVPPGRLLVLIQAERRVEKQKECRA